MKKKTDSQMSLNFDDANNNGKKASSKNSNKKDINNNCFPRKKASGTLWEVMSAAVKDIDAYLATKESTIASTIFHYTFVEGMNNRDIEVILPQEIQGKKLTAERIRQIAWQIAEELSEGKQVKMLGGIKFRDSLLERIAQVKDAQYGMYVDQKTVKKINAKMFKGFSLFLLANIVERDTVLPMMKGYFMLSKSIFRERFKPHYIAVYVSLQEIVRPATMDVIIEKVNQREEYGMQNQAEPSLVELILQDVDVFESGKNDKGEPVYWIKSEYLNNVQLQARLIYEMKSVTAPQLKEAIRKMGNDCKSFSLTLTHKRYPWCVPMGKTMWLYRPDEASMEKIQDVIERYCKETVRFTQDQIIEYLESLDYTIKEKSLRIHLLKFCRRLHSDTNTFCLIEAVPEEEDRLWWKKPEESEKARAIENMKEMDKLMVKTVKKAENKLVPRKELRKRMASFLNSRKLNSALFYKHLEKHPKLMFVEIDGVQYVTTKKK